MWYLPGNGAVWGGGFPAGESQGESCGSVGPLSPSGSLSSFFYALLQFSAQACSGYSRHCESRISQDSEGPSVSGFRLASCWRADRDGTSCL